MRSQFILAFIIISILSFSIRAVFIPADVYKQIHSGKVPQDIFPALEEGACSPRLSIIPNYFLTDLSFSSSSWWDVIYEPDIFYIVDDIPPSLKTIFHVEMGEVSIHTELFSGKEYMALRKWPSTSFFFIPTYPYFSFDTRFPYISYLAFRFDNQSLFIGRGKIRWGYWNHPVAISGVFPYLDNITYSLEKEKFRYTVTLASINPVLSEKEEKIQLSTRPVNADPLSPYFEKVKSLIAHRVDLSISDSMSLYIGELTIVGGKALDLFSIDPMSILHNNFNEGYTNSMLDTGFEWTFAKGLNFYLEFALDDLAIPLTEPEDVKPTAFGLTTGLIKTMKIFNLPGYIEFSYVKTTRWMYNTFLPYLKFNARYVFLSNFPVGSRAIVDYPLGFEYGPDAQMLSMYTHLSGRVNVESEIALLLKGPATIETEYKSELSNDVKTHILLKTVISFKNGLHIFFKSADRSYLLGGWWEISAFFQ